MRESPLIEQELSYWEWDLLIHTLSFGALALRVIAFSVRVGALTLRIGAVALRVVALSTTFL